MKRYKLEFGDNKSLFILMMDVCGFVISTDDIGRIFWDGSSAYFTNKDHITKSFTAITCYLSDEKIKTLIDYGFPKEQITEVEE